MHERAQFGFERVDLAGQLTDAGDELARDAHAHAGAAASAELMGDAVELARAVQRALGQAGLKLGTELDQMPAQPVLRACALGHEVVAVIGQ